MQVFKIIFYCSSIQFQNITIKHYQMKFHKNVYLSLCLQDFLLVPQLLRDEHLVLPGASAENEILLHPPDLELTLLHASPAVSQVPGLTEARRGHVPVELLQPHSKFHQPVFLLRQFLTLHLPLAVDQRTLHFQLGKYLLVTIKSF